MQASINLAASVIVISKNRLAALYALKQQKNISVVNLFMIALAIIAFALLSDVINNIGIARLILNILYVALIFL